MSLKNDIVQFTMQTVFLFKKPYISQKEAYLLVKIIQIETILNINAYFGAVPSLFIQ